MQEAIRRFPLLYHGDTESTTTLVPGRSGFIWWTPDRKWAAIYGPKIFRKRLSHPLNLIHVKGQSARDAYDAIANAGVAVDGLRAPWAGDDETPAEECHQYLTNTPGLAARIKAAGFDGVLHPDVRYDDGIGIAVALIP